MSINLQTFEGAKLTGRMLYAVSGSVTPWRQVRQGIFFHQEAQEFTLADLSSELDVALEKLAVIVSDENLAVVVIDAEETEHPLGVDQLPKLEELIEEARTNVQKCRHCGRRNP